ncbi:putative Ras GTPase-activating protein-binding protein [Helianthus annuus]|nr:putative Ras GTPase-activating protein-binding protein [Helianthus annuus]
MADSAAAASQAPVSAQVVGNAFVQQYYHVLHQSTGLVHRFYQDISKLGRPEEDGSMSMTTTMDAINDKILSLNYGDFRAEIRTVDAQESMNGGVSVLVTGYLTGKDDIPQNFTQSFFLAPQDKGYFVLNDMFRYVENANHHGEDHASDEDVLASVTPEQVPEIVPVPENNISEQASVSADESHAEKVVPVENGDVPIEKEEEPALKVVDEVQDSSLVDAESQTKIEKAPKKSYASIKKQSFMSYDMSAVFKVMDMKQNGVSFSSPAPAPRKPQPKKQEQPPLHNALATTVANEPAASNGDAVENGLHEEEVEGYSVYIKGLPVSATHAMLEEEFKKFGPIKPNGIQVRSNRGFSFGFVEFETPQAVQKAIEASPITISGKNAAVEEKRSTNSRGMFLDDNEFKKKYYLV